MNTILKVGAFLFVLGLLQCESTGLIQDQCPDLDWLYQIINQAKQNTQKAEVISYQYKGQLVFYIDTCKGCADSMAIVYNCSGEMVCQFGGIAGLNTCPDFDSNATAKKVIWQN